MNFEDLQKAWQSSNPGARVTISADVLLKEVRRNQQQFWATIFWRDVREVGTAIFLTIFFLYFGLRHHQWTFDLLGLAALGVGSFMVVDRLIQRGKRPVKNDALKACIESSLHQVNHQIWLLKNVAWWYLLPLAGSLAISDTVTFCHSIHNGSPAVIKWVTNLTIDFLLAWVIYWLNQFAVRKSLIPRRQELETLLSNLE